MIVLFLTSPPIRFRAHQAPVYSVEWNTFSPSIFMTCAAEWVIKIWDVACVTSSENPRPLFTFDLGGPVNFNNQPHIRTCSTLYMIRLGMWLGPLIPLLCLLEPPLKGRSTSMIFTSTNTTQFVFKVRQDVVLSSSDLTATFSQI